MSDGPIKPDDIPNSAVELANSLRNYHRGSTLDAEALASVLNSAIELGIVSPPCHFIERDGWSPRVNGNLRIWPGKPEPGFSQYRHWKGEE